MHRTIGQFQINKFVIWSIEVVFYTSLSIFLVTSDCFYMQFY